MKTRRFIILSILSVTVSLQATSAQSNSNREYYDKAYSEITDMLEGRTALSISRAVFVAEWAYLDGNLDYEKDFCEPIKKGADYLMRMIAVNHWEKSTFSFTLALGMARKLMNTISAMNSPMMTGTTNLSPERSRRIKDNATHCLGLSNYMQKN